MILLNKALTFNESLREAEILHFGLKKKQHKTEKIFLAKFGTRRVIFF